MSPATSERGGGGGVGGGEGSKVEQLHNRYVAIVVTRARLGLSDQRSRWMRTAWPVIARGHRGWVGSGINIHSSLRREQEEEEEEEISANIFLLGPLWTGLDWPRCVCFLQFIAFFRLTWQFLHWSFKIQILLFTKCIWIKFPKNFVWKKWYFRKSKSLLQSGIVRKDKIQIEKKRERERERAWSWGLVASGIWSSPLKIKLYRW